MFAYFAIIIVNFGDFSRFVKNENELKKGNLSLLVNLILFSIFAIFIVIGADIILTLSCKKNKKHVYWGRVMGFMPTIKARLADSVCSSILCLPRFSKMGGKYDFQAI